ncbi:MAG: hypothetical protein ACOZNI_32230 [Myxococcota bacterium]
MAIVVDVGEPVPLGIGGTFARAFPADEGWHLFFGAGGGLHHLSFGEDLLVEDVGRVELTGRSDLQDHAIALCPDGTWLHASSMTRTEADDSALAFRYDADLARIAEATLARDRVDRRHNDLPIVCSPLVDATASFADPYPNDAFFIALGEDASPVRETSVHWANVTGASLAHDPDTDTIVAMAVTTELYAGRFDADFELLDSRRVEAPVEGIYWPQGLLRVGDHWIVAHVARPADSAFSQDGGDIWLEVLDLEFAVEETVRVTELEPPDGAMRPWIGLRGETLVVTWDRAGELHLSEVTLDLSVPDTGGADTGAEDTLDPIPATTTCGCGGSSAWIWLGGLAGWRRRPTRTP